MHTIRGMTPAAAVRRVLTQYQSNVYEHVKTRMDVIKNMLTINLIRISYFVFI